MFATLFWVILNLKGFSCFAGQVIEAGDLRDEHVLCLKALHRVITDSVLSACFLMCVLYLPGVHISVGREASRDMLCG